MQVTSTIAIATPHYLRVVVAHAILHDIDVLISLRDIQISSREGPVKV